MTVTRKYSMLLLILLFTSLLSPVFATGTPDAEQLFIKKCSLCHAIDKKKLGPALNTMSRDAEVLRQTLLRGRNAMPAFEGKLTAAEVDALIDYLLTQ